jgi:hypothetical protein
MTLITHWRNNNIAVILTDEMEGNFGTNQKNFVDKRYIGKDFISSYYGLLPEELREFLKVYITHDIRLNDFKINHLKHIKENIEENSGFVLVNKDESRLYCRHKEKELNIKLFENNNKIDDNLEFITKKMVFFSPQYINNEIDIKHQTNVESEFKLAFEETYEKTFNLNEIKDDFNLNILLKNFVGKIKSNRQIIIRINGQKETRIIGG